MEKLKNNKWLQLAVVYTRYAIGGAFVYASLIKIKGQRFTTESGALNPIDSAWHLFETLYQSGLYWKFIGVAQLLTGFLLMTQRYAKLGAVLYLPVIANVFVITISYYFANTPVITGSILFANILLIVWDWNELKVLVNQKPLYDISKRLEKEKIWEVIGLILFMFTFVLKSFQDNLILWGGVCFLIGLFGLVIALFKRKSVILKHL